VNDMKLNIIAERHEQHGDHPRTSRRDAPEEIARVVHRPPPLAPGVLRGDTRMTQRWVHGGFHDYQNGLSGHVVMTYYGASQHIQLRAYGGITSDESQPSSIR
jgi:AraC family transcriptional regulator